MLEPACRTEEQEYEKKCKNKCKQKCKKSAESGEKKEILFVSTA